MVKSKDEKTDNFRLSLINVIYIIIAVVIIILLFTLIDFIIHQLSAEYAVPGYYYRNKILFGSIWGLIFYFILRKWKTNLGVKSLVFSAIIAIILQARYAYEGYSWEFVIEFLFFHFFMLWPVSYIVFKFLRKKVVF